jgi:Wound-inducible basic protein family
MLLVEAIMILNALFDSVCAYVMLRVVSHSRLCCRYDVNSMLFRSFLASGGSAAGGPTAK